MPQVNVPTFDYVTSKPRFCVAAVAAFIGVVADSTQDRGAKTPANGANNTVTNFKGVSPKNVPAGETGMFVCTPGDRVVMKSNGAITRGDTVFLSTADVGKEGWAKKYTNFATDTAVMIIGHAETTSADTELVEITLCGPYIKTA